MGIIVSIIMFIISMFIAYKCCEMLEFKVTWAIFLVLSVIQSIIKNGFSGIFISIIVSAIICAIEVKIYYAIYNRTSSFLSFVLLSILIVGGLTVLLIVILTMITYSMIGNNGILAR